MRYLAIYFSALLFAGTANAQTISNLPAGTALVGTEPAPFVQSGVTVKITADQLETFVSTAMTAAANTWALDQSVPDDAYNTGTWDANLEVPTKNAVRDAFEGLVASGVSDGDKGDITVSGAGTVWDVDGDAVISASTPLIEIEGTSAAAVGPIVKFQHDSATPAASDIASSIQTFAGTDDEEVGRIDYRLTDGGTGSEDGVWDIYADVAGTSLRQMTVGGGSNEGAVVIGPHGTPLTQWVPGDLHTPALQLLSTGHHGSSIGLFRASANAFEPEFFFGKSRGSAVDYTIVQDGDALGIMAFTGANGTGLDVGVSIGAEVDGTPGASNDMPGRFAISTTADGSAAPTSRWAIGQAGRLTGPLASDPVTVFSSGGTVNPAFQILGFNTANSAWATARFSADANGTHAWLSKSRGATVGSYDIVQNGDEVGSIQFDASDGNGFSNIAGIGAVVDGTPGDGDMPGKLIFSANADGSAHGTQRWSINSAGRFTGPLIGTAQTIGVSAAIQTLGLTIPDSSVANAYFADDNLSGRMISLKSRGATVGSYTVVQSGDEIGTSLFYGADGTDAAAAAGMTVTIDGTPGNDDMPGRIGFATAPDGSASLSTRMVIKNDGGVIIGTNDTSPGAKTLNVDDNGIFKISEAEANGDNFKAFQSTAAITADTTCTFEDDANFIPDSCVGDGSDASDARLKTGFRLANADAVGTTLDKIKVYDFQWNADAPKIADMVRKGKPGFGVKAQEFYEVMPAAVHVGGNDPMSDPWTWKPEKLVPYLIVEIQNLRARVAELENAR